MDLKFERTNYPDGQISAKWIDALPEVELLKVRQRINSYADLLYVKSIAEVLDYKGYVRDTCLFIPYLFGSRSDRRFTEDQSMDLRQIAEIVNSCNFGRVEILDPHSDVSMYAINKSRKVSSFEYVKKAALDISSRLEGKCEITLIAPDAGAYKKVFEYGKALEYPVVGAMKHRDLKGNIDLKFIGDVDGKDCLIVDDLCDGGYTFEVLGKKLIEQGARSRYLYVSHGIFSKGFTELQKYYNHIYCTNSIYGLEGGVETAKLLNNFITQYKVI